MGKYTKKEEVETNTKVVEPQAEEVAPKTTTKKTVEKTSEKTTEKSVEKTETKTKKKFEPSDMISCRSVCQGGLYLEGARTKMPYEWTDYGATEDVEYRDLVELVRTRSSYIFNPFFVIDNNDFVEEFPQLKKFYQENYSIKELAAILDLPVNEMVAQIKTLPKGALESLKSIAASQVSAGQLDSVRKIKELDNIFKTDLNLLSDLFK